MRSSRSGNAAMWPPVGGAGPARQAHELRHRPLLDRERRVEQAPAVQGVHGGAHDRPRLDRRVGLGPAFDDGHVDARERELRRDQEPDRAAPGDEDVVLRPCRAVASTSRDGGAIRAGLGGHDLKLGRTYEEVKPKTVTVPP
ncbi:hypothetical protein Acsp06_49440 [Actinomycetospora sp. NBRC 106375]|nr:hypothetical protein [Actinomycetospora sp. NBRC 106375]GLZ48759.1 hypothetical protein Acsp06_49440 [Actinomycetospora sp. NBRC 106375]